MRHRKRTAKLGRTGQHRNAMLANLVCSLIKHKRVTTTLARAKAATLTDDQASYLCVSVEGPYNSDQYRY